MNNEIARTCMHCGNTYRNIYLGNDKYPYTIETKYCSRSCASKARGMIGCIQEDRGRDALLAQAREIICKKDRYTTSDEICKGIKCSSKSLTKHRISVAELNTELGYSRKGSAFEERVADILNTKFDHIERQKTFDGLNGKTGHQLRVDFYIPEINTVVEADGSQHTNPDHPWHNFNNGTVAEYDEIKNDFFAKKDIPVIRVAYKERLKDVDVLKLIK